MRDRNQLHTGGRVFAALLGGLLATSAVAPSAFAQPKAPAAEAGENMTAQQRKSAARKHYGSGKTKLEARNYAGALVEFQAANALIPSPQAQEKVALCYDGMHQVPEAIGAYEAFIQQAKDKTKLAAAVDRAKRRIDALNARVPVKVMSEPGSATIEVDGQAEMGTTPIEIQLTPGNHSIKVSASGYESSERKIQVKANEPMHEIAFTLTKIDEPVAEPSRTPTPEDQSAPQADGYTGTKRVPYEAYIAFGVAGVSAIVGTVSGVKALGHKSEFNEDPTTDKADDAQRNALISDIAFGAAIALGVTGTVLLLSKDTASAEQATGEGRTKKTMRLTPYVGLSGGGASATWQF